MDEWKLGLLILLAPMLITGCKTLTGGEPDWMANPKAVYPEAQYLVAVGEGDTRHAAENAADANLSRIFEANIHSDERLLDQSRESGGAFERTTDFTADINILSSQTLHNIQHAESWRDERARVHAVAYLDRRETAAIYRGMIDEKNARVHFLMAQAEQSASLLKKYAALRAAGRHAAESKLLLSQLKVIHPPSVPGSTPGYSKNNLRKALADTAKQIRVQIQIAGDDEKRITSCLEETDHTLRLRGRPARSARGRWTHCRHRYRPTHARPRLRPLRAGGTGKGCRRHRAGLH